MTTAPASLTAVETSAAIATHLEQAWNHADGPAFGEVFTENCDFVDVRGDHHRSRAAVAAGHQAILDSIYRGSQVRYEVTSARPVTPDCVIAVLAGTLDAPSGPLQGVNHSTITMLLVASEGRWLVEAFHNTLVMQRS